MEIQVEHFITKEQLNKLDAPEAKFILEHAEKQLKDILDTNLLIVNRTTTLLTITVGFMVGLVGFSLNHWEKQPGFDAYLITAAIGLVYLFILAILLCVNIQPKKYITIGAHPKDFFHDNIYCLDKDFRLICIYVNEIESYQARIVANKAVNDRRWRLFNRSLWIIVATPGFLSIVYFLTTYFLSRP